MQLIDNQIKTGPGRTLDISTGPRFRSRKDAKRRPAVYSSSVTLVARREKSAKFHALREATHVTPIGPGVPSCRSHSSKLEIDRKASAMVCTPCFWSRTKPVLDLEGTPHATWGSDYQDIAKPGGWIVLVVPPRLTAKAGNLRSQRAGHR